MNSDNLLKNRPAETGAICSAVAVLICYFAGVDDPGILAALTVVVGAIPGLITWAVVTFRKNEA